MLSPGAKPPVAELAPVLVAVEDEGAGELRRIAVPPTSVETDGARGGGGGGGRLGPAAIDVPGGGACHASPIQHSPS